MSVEAMGWAFRQKLPPKPKIVLLALADQTDETTGRVCYGKTDLGHLSQKCSIPERSLYRFIGALVRNGYMLRESGKDRGQANAYWLRLDRTICDDWSWKSADAEADEVAGDAADEPADEPQDVVEGSANLADLPEAAEAPETAQNGIPGSAIGGRQGDSTEERKVTREESEKSKTPSFSRSAQDLERQGRAIEQAAARAKIQAFVIENSRAWKAWIDYRRSRREVGSLPVCWGQGEHAGKRGWYMPTLFPPQSTGPPEDSPPALSASDIDDFTK